MLDYEWDQNPSSLVLSGDDHRNPTPPPLSIFDNPSPYSDHHRHVNSISPPLLSSCFSTQHHLPTVVYGHDNHHHHHHQFHPHSFYDHPHTSDDPIYHPHSPLFSFDHTGSASSYNFLVPKTELDFTSSNRIGLNLGGRTYFSAADDDDFVSRLYRRSRAPGESGMGNSALRTPRCQAEGCNADLSHAKHYHRRHKVCEFHSKASTVVAAGLSQRFCQQCSRFHLLSEFDNGKRSCRKRLADHNRRRRKCHQSASATHVDTGKPALKSSPKGSRMKPSSPPTISLECFRQRQFHQTAASSSKSACSSSNSMFF